MCTDDATITALLGRLANGDRQAADTLIARVHQDLRNIAASQMLGQSADHTLQITALVNEAVVRLMKAQGGWRDHKHFFASAACIMRHVLVNHARRKKLREDYEDDATRRVDAMVMSYEARVGDLEELDEALRSLARFDPDGALFVELRFILGLPMAVVAESMGMSLRAAERKWTNVRKWLFLEMSRDA